MKFSNFLIKYGLILTLVCLVFLLILQPFNYREYKKSEQIIDTFNQEVNNLTLKINYAEVEIQKSEDDKIRIAYFEEKDSTLNKTYVGDNLVVSLKNQFKIGANTMYPVTLYLPVNKKINVDFTLSVGNIFIEDINVNELIVDQGIGYLNLDGSYFNTGELFQSIGKMEIENTVSNKLLVNSDIGLVVLKNVISNNDFSLRKSVGRVKAREVYASNVKAKNYVGSIDYLNKDNFNYRQLFIDVVLGNNKNNLNTKGAK